MSRVRRITQLELEGFARELTGAEGAGEGKALTHVEIRVREMAAKEALKARLIEKGFTLETTEQRKAEADATVREEKDLERAPSWAEQYHRLLNASIPWKIAAYIAWSTVPKRFRWPETQEELATDVLGLNSDRRIAEWRRKYAYIDQMIADLQAEAMLEYVPGAIHALGQVASDPSYRANPDRRTLFEITRLLTPRQKIEVDEGGRGVARDLIKELDKLSTAEIIEKLGPDALELIDELRSEVEEAPLPPEGGIPPNRSTDLGEEADAEDEDGG